jgi:hypothetical protein
LRNKILVIVTLVIIAFLIASFVNSYWETIPYARYKTGEEITGFPYGTTSMTVNGFSTAPDITFPQSSTDIFVNVTIHYLGSNSKPSAFPGDSNKFLVISYETGRGREASAWNGFNGSLGIVAPEPNPLTTNQSVAGYIRFVLGNGNYTAFQLICRAQSQEKPLFIVDLQNP